MSSATVIVYAGWALSFICLWNIYPWIFDVSTSLVDKVNISALDYFVRRLAFSVFVGPLSVWAIYAMTH